MAVCGYSSLVHSSCGSSKFNPLNTECVTLGSCKKDIKGHLTTFNTSDQSLNSEADLLLARAGIFEPHEHSYTLSICPRHRDEFGVRWLSNKKTCSMPPDWAPHKNHPRKGDRGFTHAQSKLLHSMTTILVPIASPICKRCRLLLGDEKHFYASASPVQTPGKELQDDQCSSFVNVSEAEPEDIRIEEINISEAMGNLTIGSTTSLFSGENASITTSGSSGSGKERPNANLDIRREKLNDFLVASGKSPIGQSKKAWTQLSSRTKTVHITKGKDAVIAVLDVIAPGHPDALWEDLKSSQVVEIALDVNYPKENTAYLEALAETYQNALSWDTRRQILSIMADLVPYPVLQKYIPGITRYRVKTARHHKVQYGRGAPMPSSRSPKMCVNPTQLDHFLTFITSPHVIQDLPYGQRYLKLTDGRVLETPNVIRSMISQRIIDQYLQFSSEINFQPFSQSTMKRILSACTATVRKSLQGLDYFAADGAKAFDDLQTLVEKLCDHGLDRQMGNNCKLSLKTSKQYLKTDYKVHVSVSSNVADHCISYALSDPSESTHALTCNHAHDEYCASCEQLNTAIEDLESYLGCAMFSDEDRDDLFYTYEQAVKAINAWKAHQLRSIQQDKARTDVLETLDETSVLITEDWAMKLLPQKYRETQSDWFAKRGISWHISVVVSRIGGVLQHQVFVHIVKNTSQDNNAIMQIFRHTLSELKKENPKITSAFLRQDNAGCYHNAAVLAACRLMEKDTGIKVKRVDFSDPQGGKGPCDRKAATIKAHVRRYLNEGNDVSTAEDFRDAILSYGGVHGVRVALVDARDIKVLSSDKWEGINSLNNFLYKDNASEVTVWRAYQVGDGKTLMWSELNVDSQIPDCTFQVPFSAGCFVEVTASKAAKKSKPQKHLEEGSDEEEVASEESEKSEVGLFSCPFEGCIKTFQRHSNLEHHMSYGKCLLQPEKSTLLDKAKMVYQRKLLEGASEQPLLAAISQQSSDKIKSLNQGWALKTSKSGKRFNKNQKSYLDDKFALGRDTGIKADPEQVSRDMRRAKTEDGSRRFKYEEFLTAKQIKSYFSRTAKNTAKGKPLEAIDDKAASEDQSAYSSARNHILQECQITHPVIYDTYNVCQLYAKDRLKKLSVALLRHICVYFDIQVDGLPQKRKAPYLALITELVQACTCAGKKD